MASQLTVTLGGLAFTVSGSASPVMGERVRARMAPLGLHGWRQRLSREGVALLMPLGFRVGSSAFPVMGERKNCAGAAFQADCSAFPKREECMWCRAAFLAGGSSQERAWHAAGKE